MCPPQAAIEHSRGQGGAPRRLVVRLRNIDAAAPWPCQRPHLQCRPYCRLSKDTPPHGRMADSPAITIPEPSRTSCHRDRAGPCARRKAKQGPRGQKFTMNSESPTGSPAEPFRRGAGLPEMSPGRQIGVTVNLAGHLGVEAGEARESSLWLLPAVITGLHWIYGRIYEAYRKTHLHPRLGAPMYPSQRQKHGAPTVPPLATRQTPGSRRPPHGSGSCAAREKTPWSASSSSPLQGISTPRAASW